MRTVPSEPLPKRYAKCWHAGKRSCLLSFLQHRIDGKNGFLTAVLRQKMAADASDLRVIHAHVVWQGNQSLSEILELIFLLTDPVRKRRDCDPFWAYMHLPMTRRFLLCFLSSLWPCAESDTWKKYRQKHPKKGWGRVELPFPR